MTRTVLLVEDNPSDEKLTLRALGKCHMINQVAVVRDGAEALDYLFATGSFAGSDPTDLPALVLLDLKLPRIDGLEVLRRIRADGRTRFLPVVILTTSKKPRTSPGVMSSAPMPMFASRSTSPSSCRRRIRLACSGCS